MDNQSEPQPSFEVPRAPDQQESGPVAAPEKISKQELPSPSSPPPSNPVSTPSPAPIAEPASSVPVDEKPPKPAPAVASNTPANDADLIEKQWVEKAKNIVNSTKNDPFVQNRELNKVKAEYVSKRFNKQLKTSEDSAT